MTQLTYRCAKGHLTTIRRCGCDVRDMLDLSVLTAPCPDCGSPVRLAQLEMSSHD
ncbi:MAG TPA: hypothetical protein VIG51_09835 [Candidatus Baltobacteraceae bacterium]|jgi:hypothetical protein